MLKRTIIAAAAVAILGGAAFSPNTALARAGGNSNGGKSTTGQSAPRVDAKPTKPTIHSKLKIRCQRYRRSDGNGGSVTLATCG